MNPVVRQMLRDGWVTRQAFSKITGRVDGPNIEKLSKKHVVRIVCIPRKDGKNKSLFRPEDAQKIPAITRQANSPSPCPPALPDKSTTVVTEKIVRYMEQINRTLDRLEKRVGIVEGRLF